jgi:NDP-sugar pyrophosphorylase family protein
MTAEPGFPVAILAGGLATRMRPATDTIPKALLPVAGEPFVAHQLRLLRRAGLVRVVLCVGHLGDRIQEFVGGGDAFDLRVTYSRETGKLLGTGGALRLALPLLGTAFFVLYGDSYLDIDYEAVQRAFEASDAPALMTVYRNEGLWDASNVLFDGTRVVRYDKRHPSPDMRYIDYGLGVLSARALREPAEDAFDLADVYRRLAVAGRLIGYEAPRRFYEIGTPAGLAETEAFISGARA